MEHYGNKTEQFAKRYFDLELACKGLPLYHPSRQYYQNEMENLKHWIRNKGAFEKELQLIREEHEQAIRLIAGNPNEELSNQNEVSSLKRSLKILWKEYNHYPFGAREREPILKKINKLNRQLNKLNTPPTSSVQTFHASCNTNNGNNLKDTVFLICYLIMGISLLIIIGYYIVWPILQFLWILISAPWGKGWFDYDPSHNFGDALCALGMTIGTISMIIGFIRYNFGK